MTKWLLIMYLHLPVHGQLVMEFDTYADCRSAETMVTQNYEATECQLGRVLDHEWVVKGGGAFIPKM